MLLRSQGNSLPRKPPMLGLCHSPLRFFLGIFGSGLLYPTPPKLAVRKPSSAQRPGLTGRCRWAGVPACLLITAPAMCNCWLRATNLHSPVLLDSTRLESWNRGLQPAGWGRGPRPSAHPLRSQRLLLLPAGCSRPGARFLT